MRGRAQLRLLRLSAFEQASSTLSRHVHDGFVVGELLQQRDDYMQLCEASTFGNVFHAGDGNLHPLILFDSQVPGEVERVRQARRESRRPPARRTQTDGV